MILVNVSDDKLIYNTVGQLNCASDTFNSTSLVVAVVRYLEYSLLKYLLRAILYIQ